MKAGPRVLEIPDDVPYDPFRSTLYTRDELMGDGLDGRIERYVLDQEQLWVNPDCGLKTRRYQEVEPALRNMVDAARQVRKELAPTPA